jgi:hypothetical protein
MYPPLARTAKAGISGVRFHDWRQYHASRLVTQGASAKVVRERSGHAGVWATLRFHVHPHEEAQKPEAEQFDALLRSTKRAKPDSEICCIEGLCLCAHQKGGKPRQAPQLLAGLVIVFSAPSRARTEDPLIKSYGPGKSAFPGISSKWLVF